MVIKITNILFLILITNLLLTSSTYNNSVSITSSINYSELTLYPTNLLNGDLITINLKIINLLNTTNTTPVIVLVDGISKFEQNVTLDARESRTLEYKFRIQDETGTFGNHKVEVNKLIQYYNVSPKIQDYLYYSIIIIIISVVPLYIILKVIKNRKKENEKIPNSRAFSK
jgi:hypothetical protein